MQTLEDRFEGPELDTSRWVPHYLPQWTTPERSQARYELGAEGLRLRIDADQPAWRPEDGELRVSNLQTGTRSGPAGSADGTHRHRPDLAVVSPQHTRRLLLPTGGRAEAVLRATADPTVMLAFWMVGFEEAPAEAGELCVAELRGGVIGPGRSTVTVGVKAHHDPQLVDDVVDVELPIDATRWHAYAVEWGAAHDGIAFLVDDVVVHRSPQRIVYPLQLMVDLFEFPPAGYRDPAAYPKVGYVRAVRLHP